MKYAVFLRGINTGGMTLLKNDFKHLLEMAGCKHVVTIQAAGTAVFMLDQLMDADRQANLEKRLSEHIGKSVSSIIKTADELVLIAEHVSRLERSPESVDYIFLIKENKVYESVVTLHEAIPFMPGERLIRGEGYFIWTIKKGHTLAEFGSKVLGSKKLKEQLTSRNAATMQKVASAIHSLPTGT